MAELEVFSERKVDRPRDTCWERRDVASILARAVRAGHLEDRRRLFELAVWTDPECAVAWLWLATMTDRETTADARIRTALDLDLGPPAWRDACGELLIAMALRRAAQDPSSACATLIEAQYVKPRDARVWVALATACTTLPMRLSYLERALELDGVDRERIRATLLTAAIDGAIEMLREGRMSASYDLLLRAVAAAPEDEDLRAIVARLGAPIRHGSDHPRVAPAARTAGTGARWTRAPLAERSESPAFSGAWHALTSYKASIAGWAGLLKEFASPGMCTALVESAASLTAPVDDASRRPGDG